jgi:hypothetical protein
MFHLHRAYSQQGITGPEAMRPHPVIIATGPEKRSWLEYRAQPIRQQDFNLARSLGLNSTHATILTFVKKY